MTVRLIADLPRDHYSLGMIDPPWRFEVRERKTGLDKSPDAHYGTMTTEQLCALRVGPLFKDDAYLAMWVYDPMLPDALSVASAWGFGFVTVLFRWLKGSNDQYRLFQDGLGEPLKFGMGYHTRGGGCEECWLFKMGKGLPVQRHDIRKEFFSPRREHSRKPDEVAQWLVDLYGDVPRVDGFARTQRPGWDAFGNEVGKFP